MCDFRYNVLTECEYFGFAFDIVLEKLIIIFFLFFSSCNAKSKNISETNNNIDNNRIEVYVNLCNYNFFEITKPKKKTIEHIEF